MRYSEFDDQLQPSKSLKVKDFADVNYKFEKSMRLSSLNFPTTQPKKRTREIQNIELEFIWNWKRRKESEQE